MAAKGGLLEETRDEFVVLHLVHVLLAERALAREPPEARALLLTITATAARSAVRHDNRRTVNRSLK